MRVRDISLSYLYSPTALYILEALEAGILNFNLRAIKELWIHLPSPGERGRRGVGY